MQVELDAVVKAAALRKADGALDGHHVGTVDGVEVIAGLAGIGIGPSARAAQLVLTDLAPDHVIVSGIAGGIDRGLAIGDLVVPERVTDAGSGATHTATPLGPTLPAGLLITTDGLWTHDDLIVHPLVADHGAIAVDMETSAVAEVCDASGIPWTAFRGISDRTFDGFIDDEVMALTREDGSTDGKAVAKLLARRPWVVPRLARLARGMTLATGVAATATVAACRAWARPPA